MTTLYQQIEALKAEKAAREKDYDALYAEWRQKNDACNEAYAITIPRLRAVVIAARDKLSLSLKDVSGCGFEQA